MPDAVKPSSRDPARSNGRSERRIVSHREDDRDGAVKRLNAIEQHLAEPNRSTGGEGVKK